MGKTPTFYGLVEDAEETFGPNSWQQCEEQVDPQDRFRGNKEAVAALYLDAVRMHVDDKVKALSVDELTKLIEAADTRVGRVWHSQYLDHQLNQRDEIHTILCRMVGCAVAEAIREKMFG